MIARFAFIAIAGFWLTMNCLLWRAEFGARGGDADVPFALVWRKILTAPDSSSLSIYHKGDRTGYCEFSTSVGQQMAELDAEKLPPEGLIKKAGYQIHLAGNISIGDFSNRLKFEGTVQFSNPRTWRELRLRIATRETVLDVYSLATNQTVHCRIMNDGTVLERDLAFNDLKNPTRIFAVLGGGLPDFMLMGLDFPELSGSTAAPPEWTSFRTRYQVGKETIPVYELQSVVMGHKVRVVVSTLGEIMRVELPGDLVARVDE